MERPGLGPPRRRPRPRGPTAPRFHPRFHSGRRTSPNQAREAWWPGGFVLIRRRCGNLVALRGSTTRLGRPRRAEASGDPVPRKRTIPALAVSEGCVRAHALQQAPSCSGGRVAKPGFCGRQPGSTTTEAPEDVLGGRSRCRRRRRKTSDAACDHGAHIVCVLHTPNLEFRWENSLYDHYHLRGGHLPRVKTRALEREANRPSGTQAVQRCGLLELRAGAFEDRGFVHPVIPPLVARPKTRHLQVAEEGRATTGSLPPQALAVRLSEAR